MVTKLFPYEYVPPGFEIVIDLGSGAEHGHQGEIVPGSKGGIWNLWWNITLSDSPQTWDDEVMAINKMQEHLGKLTDNYRLIRAQMAELCRDSPPFPLSIDILCEEIGTGQFSTPVRMGCEGRNLLETLGYHTSESRDNQQAETLRAYATSLYRWLEQSSPQDPVDSKVFGFLGQPKARKQAFAEKLASGLDFKMPLLSSIIRLCYQECQQTYGDSVLGIKTRPAICFSCLQDNPPENRLPTCCCSMIIDVALICSGTFNEDRSFYDYRLFREENALTYAAAINSWLKGAPAESVQLPRDGQFITSAGSLQIARNIHSSLGKKNQVKEWLAASLLKTVKSNQRWHDRTELIDNFPQATSWLSEIA